MSKFARLDRLPPYVFATVNELKMEARREGKDIIDLGMGNPDLGTPQHIVDKLIEATNKPHNHRYSASMGITKLREAISSWYERKFSVDIDPDTETIVVFLTNSVHPEDKGDIVSMRSRVANVVAGSILKK